MTQNSHHLDPWVVEFGTGMQPDVSAQCPRDLTTPLCSTLTSLDISGCTAVDDHAMGVMARPAEYCPTAGLDAEARLRYAARLTSVSLRALRANGTICGQLLKHLGTLLDS